jgi:hypothetical protein
MSWVVLIWNLLALAYVIGSLVLYHHHNLCGPANATPITYCSAAIATVDIMIVIWLVVDAILGLLWLVTKGNRRKCPVCGLPVKAGKLRCKKCGYDFRSVPAYAPTPPVAPPTVPAGWFPDPQGSGQLRYWDGIQWTTTIRPN